MKLLVIEDDRDISDFLKANLPAKGFAVDLAEDGKQGIALSCVNEYDLVILDLNLPDMSGEEVCTILRKKKRVAPILMLSVISDAASKARLLNAGADDYLAKPFSFEELIARIRALLRRTGAITPDVLEVDTVVVDIAKQTAYRGRRNLELTKKEFAILAYLMRNQDAVVSKSALIEHVWESTSNAFSDSIETHMVNLRKKLGRPELIHTVHGRGYRVYP